MRIPRMEVFLVVFPVAIGLLGYLCWGLVGLLIAFWIGLLWFSLVHQPRRHELTLISGLGLIGAFAFLPNAIWMKPHLVLATCFIGVAISPAVYVFVRPMLLAKRGRNRPRR